MASEIRVNKIENRSGLGTVTFADTGVDLAGIVTATTFSGSGASLTALPAGNLTGTVADARISTLTASKLSGALPAISAASLTNVPAANVVGVHTSLNVTGSTTTGSAVVGSGVTINSDGIVAAGIAVTCGSINGAPIGRKNVLINGAFNVWQRGTSVTLLNSAKAMLCDRWAGSINYQAGRHSRQSLSGAITGQGGTYCLRVGSSNGTDTRISAGQQIEAINATPLAGRECTLSFYIKFSAANITASSGDYGDFQVFSNYYTGVDESSYTTTPASSETHLQINAGSFPTTWTKYTNTFTPPSTSKNMNVRFQFAGLGQTSSDDAFYYEISNVQLELGSQATPFEHTSYGEELALCQRYYQVISSPTTSTLGFYGHNSNFYAAGKSFHTQMRTTPSTSTYQYDGSGTNYWVEPGVQAFSANSTTGITIVSTDNSFYFYQSRQAGNSTPTRITTYVWEPAWSGIFEAEL